MIYYLPNHQGSIVTRAHFVERGLGHVLDAGEQPCGARTERGPDGGKGMLACAPPRTPFPKGEMTWRRMPPGLAATPPARDSAAWMGYPTDAPSGPEDLARGRIYDGTRVPLRDGRAWTVPLCVARFAARPITLPVVYDVDEAGDWVGKVDGRYESLCEATGRFFEVLLAQTLGAAQEEGGREGGGGERAGGGEAAEAGATMTVAQVMDLAVMALGVNYRVSRAEVGLLGLLSDEAAVSACQAACDWGEVLARAREAQKKSTEPTP